MKQTKPVCLGVIGGSGLYNVDGITIKEEHSVHTPFGEPSDVVVEAEFNEKTIYFLPRHGRGHRYTPSEVNYRANICALKSMGVTHVLSVSAVGIMQENIKPGDMIVPDQIFDRTKGTRASTFFGEGVVGHVSFADPFSTEMRKLIIGATRKHTDRVHDGGCIVVMEGPQFSTRSESHFYRKTLDPVAIGMTALPEAKLAREAEMAYGLLATATDYDCWNETEDDVSVEAVVKVLQANAALAHKVIKEIITDLPKDSADPALFAAEQAIMTNPEAIPQQTKDKLSVLYDHYFSLRN